MSQAARKTAKKSIAGRIPVILCLIASLLTASRHALAQNVTTEYQLKAAFVFHFAQLVEWPADASDASKQSIVLCLLAESLHKQDIRSTIQGKAIGARVISVRELHKPQEVPGCDILFLGREEILQQRELLAGLSGKPVLTIGETDSFLKDGGIVCFHLEGDKIRFDINLAAAESAQLRISSRLLLLATRVLRSSAEQPGGQ